MSETASTVSTSRADQYFAEFQEDYDFTPDPFQVDACRALEQGNGVLVAAPTGSGKTLVGEFAVHLALAEGRKCFYTTPIKALSNQKFNDLVDRHGADNVGLLTGDNTINGEAPIVVMTTEVLRNMLYAASHTLTGLAYVVMDEVHYLADRFRGAVWEEVIIALPESVSVVSLSATVSNAEEFGDWLTEVRGNNITVVEEQRPVPLHQHIMVGRKLFGLFGPDGKNVNRAVEKLARDDLQYARLSKGYRSKKGQRPHNRNYTPRRTEMIGKLDAEGLLPAIVFIFSRNGCDAAVQHCRNDKLLLTSAEERAEIRAFVAEACADIPREDLEVLGYFEFLEGLCGGVAAHHAGMLPTFKECVEHLFTRGLVKVVFATETLALGINMPARSVVLDRLTKWNGETHADITPGEYTQLTGRAGRRGIDVEGHGVVLWQRGLDPDQVAGLASTRTYPLKSSFQPSYNMAVNLIPQVGRSTARELLEQSFAQFQADRAVVGLARQIRKAEEGLEGYREAATCDRGDFMEYADMRRRLSELESGGAKRRRSAERAEITESLESLRPGDVIKVPTGRWAGLAVVLDPGRRGDRDGPRPFVLTLGRHARRLALVDFNGPVAAIAQMRIPKKFNPRNPSSRRDLASALRSKTHGLDEPYVPPRDRSTVRSHDPEVEALRQSLRDHPCHDCPDRESHARWAERYQKLERDTKNQRRRIESRTNSVARQFDRVCEVLDTLKYLDGDQVTMEGLRLQRLYGELDLLASECIRKGVWDDLEASELAAVLSGLTFASRGTEASPPPQYPTIRIEDAAENMMSLGTELQRLERDHHLKYLSRPDFGFALAAYNWATGAELDDVLGLADLSAGDFVRAVKQLIDVTAQVADASGSGRLRDTAREAVESMRRGVVSYTSIHS